jgi:hypothetical protein
MSQSIELIPKEEIKNHRFVKVRTDMGKELRELVNRAERLGNSFKGKVTIVFETENGPKKTETTVWNSTNEFIQLKGGVMIPIVSISEILY